MELASQKGASTELKSLSHRKYNFCLANLEFRYRLDLRHRRKFTKVPGKCPCEEKFNIMYALRCAKSRCTYIRQNKIGDTFMSLMNEVCY